MVGSVCHGPAAFVNVKVDGDYMVKGKEVTAFSDSEEKAVGKDKARPHCCFRAQQMLGLGRSAIKPVPQHMLPRN